MLIEEQEEVIAMLERLRAKKRYVLRLSRCCWLERKGGGIRAEYCVECRVHRLQLRDFSDKVIDTKAAGYSLPPLYQYAGGIGGAGGGGAAGSNAQMEVDSNASTPA